MGIGSSLLQFVESLRQDPAREETTQVTARPTPPPVVTRPDPLLEVARAVTGSRQRLEALADQLAALRDKVGGGSGSSPAAR